MGTKKNPNATAILQDAHNRMIAKYSPGAALEKSKAQAQEIQNFLYALKKAARQRKNGNAAEKLNNDFIDAVLDSIVLPNGRTLYNLFARVSNINQKTGQYFEDDFAAVIAAVINVAEGRKKSSKKDYEKYGLGQSVGTTDIDLMKVAEDEVNDFTDSLVYTTAEELEKHKPGFVFGKIDTVVNEKIINNNTSIDISPSLLEALSFASFSDKSYKSKGWSTTLNEEIDLGNTTIHLGKSDPYRAILGSMSYLGFSKTDSTYVYYAGQNIIAGMDTDPPAESPNFISQHIYHLRYLYELTGVGIIYKDYGSEFINGAKFFVYNDPNSDEIIVISTAQIITDILSSQNESNPFGGIGVAKSALRAYTNSSKKN